jgi:cell wall-associated NlpC family hydrolase
MSTPRVKARHRAEDPITSPTNTIPLNHGKGQHRAAPTRKTAMSVATGGLMVLTTLTAPAGQAEAPTPKADTADTGMLAKITADPAVVLKPARVAVATAPKPVPPPPPAPPKPVYTPPPAPAPVVRRAPAPAPVVRPAPRHVAVATPAPHPTNMSKAARIASAALGQLGWAQDCTRLVSNSLLAVGISFHDWPAGYLSLGYRVSAAQAIPGDLLYYANGGMGVAHIAVYIGNGMAVHGGWNGNMTVTFSANIGSGPVYIRVA